MPRIIYPSVEEIIETNHRVLSDIQVKKADRHRILSRSKIESAVQKTMGEKGDIYDKAAVLLTELVQGHAFASGVRRTAFAVAISFLRLNGEDAIVFHDPKVLAGIRERFYTMEEVKNWLKGSEIRKFSRA